MFNFMSNTNVIGNVVKKDDMKETNTNGEIKKESNGCHARRLGVGVIQKVTNS